MADRKFSFEAKLERLAKGIEYYGLTVPAKITRALQTSGAVPILALFNGAGPFRVNLYPLGGGRHGLRVKAEIRLAAKAKEGSRVRVRFTLRDRAAEISVPKDVMSALRSERATEGFKAMPVGEKSFMLGKIEQAAKPETREKRIQDFVEAALRRQKRVK